VQRHDPKAVKLARALGMEPDVAFTVEAQAPERELAEAAQALESRR
jgi:hypothetical protein